MNTPDTEKRPTYKEVKEEIKKTDYFKSLDEDGNPPDTESHTTPCEGCEEETYDGTSTTYKHTCKDKNTPDTECRCTKFNKDIIDTSECELHQGNVNTPDTEWEKEVHTFVNEVAIQLKPSNDTMNAVRLIRKDLPDFIRYMRTSRDTYWKERVRKEVEGMKRKITFNGSDESGFIQYGQVIDSDCEYNQALDTLLDNLK